MQFQYLYQGGKCSLEVSPAGLVILQEFAQHNGDLIETAVVHLSRPDAQAAARSLQAEVIVKPVGGGQYSDYRLTKRGVALVSTCYDQIMGKATEPAHDVFFTYTGVEPHLQISEDVAKALDLFLPWAPSVEAYHPYKHASELPKGIFEQMADADLIVNVAQDDEPTMFVLTALGRNLRRALKERTLPKAGQPKPAAWRFKYNDDGVIENRAWSYTEDRTLIQTLEKRDDYIIQKLDVRKEEE